MVQTRGYAVVLKTFFPRRRFITVLDYAAGKIRVLPSRSYLGVGSLISYTSRITSSYPLAQHVDVHAVPSGLVYEDLFFLHHIMEVTYHFIGYGDKVSSVYDLLTYMVTNGAVWCDTNIRYLIVFKLLALLGFYPEESLFHVPAYYQFVCRPLARLESCSIPDNDIQKIIRWLRTCISNHAHVDAFNTLSFLYDKRES